MAYLKHYGTPRHSGRYPWGSGGNSQRSKSFRSYVKEMRGKGLSDTEIAKGLGMTTSQFRARNSIDKDEQRREDTARAMELKDKGYSNTAIAKEMGINESSVRNLIKNPLEERTNITRATADMLKNQVDTKGFIDIGAGVEHNIEVGQGAEARVGISRDKLKTAVELLREEGYVTQQVQVEQLGTQNKTYVLALCPPGTTYGDVAKNTAAIKTITDYTEDGGRTYTSLEPPKSISSKRVMTRYADDEISGADMDGVIELRRGVNDISLGKAKYAQVRIAVDDTHYLKGMAMYADDLPDGIDVRFNTNKNRTDNPLGAMKKLNARQELEDGTVLYLDSDGKQKVNEFGATVRQKHYVDDDGNSQLSPLNIVNEEGSWSTWSKSISSQVLSKQPLSLAQKQLDLDYKAKRDEYDEIMALTNPVVKKHLLDRFADECDSSAVEMRGAAMPRQSSHVILPIPSMKDNEVYAPNYRNGESVVLIRYPHGGRFEIPELTVNNKSRAARSVMGDAIDAIGINPRVAARLSGADFDGDTVLVIPNNGGTIKSVAPSASKSLRSLMAFDPRASYPLPDDAPRMSNKTKQNLMGQVSNLITDMTIKNANYDEIARAVRHSMVVIDAEKHHLDYKKSAIDNGIAGLKEKYQGGARRGASTLISRAGAETRVPLYKNIIDPVSGQKVSVPDTYVNRQGKTVQRTTSRPRLSTVDDAFELSSGTRMETIYATHSNSLRALAQTARTSSSETTPIPYSSTAARTYAQEVSSLRAQLVRAERNAPRERQAQIIANATFSAKKASNPQLDAEDLKKIKGQELARARDQVGAKKQRINITDREWEAIQNGAVSTNTLTSILNNTDLTSIKQRATPRTSSLSAARVSRIRAMIDSGFTRQEVADQLGLSISSVTTALTE